VNFDAPDRAACTVKRPQTSTPLQALTLQNDPVYIELAQSLADRVLLENANGRTDDRLIGLFRTVLTRQPTENELATLRSTYDTALVRYQKHANVANMLAGDRELPAGVGATDWAAWFNIAHILLNLDETITKN
jgi:hypothetical protein